jgi:alpha-galactosidase
VAFRAGTALFGSFGIEWDLTAASDRERTELAAWVALYKEVRELVHTGTVVRAPQYDAAFAVHGVVAPDRSDALFALVQLATPETSVPGVVRLPGLDPERRYRVRPQPPGDVPAVRGLRPPAWLADGVTLPGAVLEHVGVAAPALYPEQLLLVRAEAVSA